MKKLSYSLFMIATFLFMLNVNAKQYIDDKANLLNETNKLALTKQIEALVKDTHFDIVLISTNNTNGKTSEKYADDYYDQSGYATDGILMLINMQAREIWLSSSGKGITIFDDKSINSMLDIITPYASSLKYEQAYTSFLTQVKNRLLSFQWDLEKPQDQQYIYDYASLLDKTSLPAINERLIFLKNKYAIETYIISLPKEKKSLDVFLKSFYLQSNISENIILLGISETSFQVLSNGSADNLLKQEDINRIEKMLAPLWKRKKWKSVLNNFIELNDIYSAKNTHLLTLFNRLQYSLKLTNFILLISIFLSSIIVWILWWKTNKVKKAAIANYIPKDGLQTHVHKDTFLTTNISKIYIPPIQSHSSGSGSSKHISSSGKTHGGGGRKF